MPLRRAGNGVGGVDSEGADGVGVRLFEAYEVPAAILFVLLCFITIFSARHPDLLTITHSVALHVAITSISVVIALGAAYFAIGEFMLYGFLSSLFIGLAFLVFGTGDAGFGMVPLLAGWLRQTNWVAYAFGVQRIAGGALLVAAGFLIRHQIAHVRRMRLVLEAVALSLALSVTLTAWVYAAHASAVSTVAQRTLQLSAGALFFAASLLYWRISKTSGRTWFFWLSLSLALAGFAQVQYAIHAYPLGVVQPGDILRLVFFGGIVLALAAQWTADYRRLRWQARELNALHVLMTPPTVQHVQSVVDHIIWVVGDSLGAKARVLVTDRDERVMRDPLNRQILHLEPQNGNGQHAGGPSRVVATFDEGPDSQVALGVPLSTATRRLGMLVVVRPAGDEFSAHDMRLLEALGNQASVLLERSLLYEEVAAGAIVEERSRLAREIHDGLAQHLAFLKMRVSWLQRSNAPIETKQLKDIESVLETALIEARHAITTLRADVQSTTTHEAIQGYAEEFGQVAGLRVAVEGAEDMPEVGPKARVELLRVVQETLNNIRKHAQATEVTVSMSHDDSGVEVSVRDNGHGFQVDQTLEGHFGLQIMSERAQSVNGRFEVVSTPGTGTLVRIWVPRQEAETADAENSWLRLLQG